VIIAVISLGVLVCHFNIIPVHVLFTYDLNCSFPLIVKEYWTILSNVKVVCYKLLKFKIFILLN